MTNKADTKFAFSILQDLAQKSTDEAAIKVKQATDAYNSGQERLNLLNDFYLEYQAGLSQKLASGIKGAELSNYQDFITSMENSILQQKQILVTLDGKQKQALQQLQMHQKKLNAYTTLIDKRKKELIAQENRLQQKLNDEFAQQKSVRRLAHGY